MDTNRPVANQKGLHFHAFVAEDVPQTVIGDELRITQIMNNLLSNALKFTSMGAVTLEVYKTHQREDVVELTFFVTDTGIGIDAQGRQKLFQSFSQADDSITRRYGGTGLGLYVTKQLAEQMHGHIEVESEPGRGSTFSCAIKVKVPVQAVEQEKEQNIEFICMEAQLTGGNLPSIWKNWFCASRWKTGKRQKGLRKILKRFVQNPGSRH